MNDIDESEIEDLENSEEHLNGRDATIYLIDATSSMFITPPSSAQDEGKIFCPFILALKCAHNSLCQKILTADKDTIAIVLFGTNFSIPNDKYGVYPNSCLLYDLLPPEGDIITQLENLINNVEELDEFKSAALSSVSSFSDALWLCSSIFSKQKSKQDNRSIFLFTSNDQPHHGDSANLKQIEKRISDLRESSIILTLFPIGSEFDATKCFQELLCDGENSNISVFSSSYNELIAKVCRKSYKKRCVSRMMFNIGDIKVGVSLYNLIRDAPMPKKIKLDRRTNEPVKSVTTKFNAESAETLLPSELTKFTTVGGLKIKMDKEELKSFKDTFPSGLVLIGFKPVKQLNLHLFVSPSSFIYPEEETIKGSRKFFGALLERCSSRDMAALCTLKVTASTKPRLVALLPQLSRIDSFGVPMPDGFHVQFIPYSSDIRHFNYDDMAGGEIKTNPNSGRAVREIWRADDEQVAVAKEIVKKLTMRNGYTLDIFENPALHTMWKAMEGLAHNRDDMGFPPDGTLPDIAKMENKLGPLSDKFNELIFPFGSEPIASTSSRSKSVKNSDVDVESEARNGRLEKLTVDILKTFLSSRGVSGLTGKKKAQLIEMVKTTLKIN